MAASLQTSRGFSEDFSLCFEEGFAYFVLLRLASSFVLTRALLFNIDSLLVVFIKTEKQVLFPDSFNGAQHYKSSSYSDNLKYI